MNVVTVLGLTQLTLNQAETHNLMAYVQKWLEGQPMIPKGLNLQLDMARELVAKLSH